MEDWQRRDRRILEQVAECERHDGTVINVAGVAEVLGLDAADVARGLDALEDGDYISIQGRSINRAVYRSPRLRDRGRRALQLWPADGFDALVAALDTMIAAEREPAKRSKLEALRSAIGSIGRDVAVELIAAAAKAVTKLP